MKLISFLIPAYNSEEYLDIAVKSLVGGGDDVEIIIVDDGSKDRTGEIADEFAKEYKNVSVIHQENGGHGAGINAGLAVAQGLYFKVIDSDDWVDEDAYKEVLEKIRSFVKDGNAPDLLLTDFVYENRQKNIQSAMSYGNVFPPNRILRWKDTKKMKMDAYLMMHALIYKLDVLKACKLNLPIHRFYEDNLYVYVPLAYTKTIYYLPVGFYRYLVGRAGQSVETKTMAKRYKMQLANMKELTEAYSYEELRKLEPKQKRMMFHLLNVYTYLTLAFVCIEFDKTKKEDYRNLQKEIRAHDKKLYNKLRWRTNLVFVEGMPSKLRATLVNYGHGMVNKKTNWSN